MKLTRDLALPSERHGNAVWTRRVMLCLVPMLLPSFTTCTSLMTLNPRMRYSWLSCLPPEWALLLALTVHIPQATEMLPQSSHHTKMQYHLQPAGPVHVPPIAHFYLSLARKVDRCPSMTSI